MTDLTAKTIQELTQFAAELKTILKNQFANIDSIPVSIKNREDIAWRIMSSLVDTLNEKCWELRKVDNTRELCDEFSKERYYLNLMFDDYKESNRH